jgi:Putative beta-barrel porin-2, OmpL-like. bbp2
MPVSRPSTRHLTLALLALAAPATGLLAQAPDTTKAAPVASTAAPASPTAAPATPAAPSTPIESGVLGVTLSGYVETAFNSSTGATGGAITGRLYERTNNQFTLNALKLSLDRPVTTTKVDAGFHADLILGQNAPVLQSNGLSLGPNGDVYQLFGTLNVPTPNGNGLQIKLGRMATFLGLEVIETPLNPNLSIANQFIYAENFTQTGLSVEHRFNQYVDAQVRVFNGWDQVQDLNGVLSYMGRLGIAPNASTSIAVMAFTGAEEADNNTARRSGVEVLASRKIGKVTTFVQGDVGREARNSALPDATQAAKWTAAGAWLVVDATPTIGVALRGDVFNDRNGARTSAAYGLEDAVQHRLTSATATLNIKSFPSVMLRPELRFDHSNLNVFNGKQRQITFGFGATYIF